MNDIIRFKTGEDFDAIRFVKSYRKRRFLRREKIEYTMCLQDAMTDICPGEYFGIAERVLKDYPGAEIRQCSFAEFKRDYEKNRFWVISKRDGDGQPVEFYKGNDGDKAAFTGDIRDALIGLDEKCEIDTIGTLRGIKEGCAVSLDMIYCNMVNNTLLPLFVILCQEKEDRQHVSYFDRREGGKVQTVNVSEKATRFTYSEAVSVYGLLRANCKDYSYAVIPAPADNIWCADLPDYMKTHKISRRIPVNVVMSKLKLKGM